MYKQASRFQFYHIYVILTSSIIRNR